MIAVQSRFEDPSVAKKQDMKTRVFLHIGHPKTGSSAFQTCLARSHNELADEGILYPYHRSFALASRNHISSGNLSIGPENENWMTTGVLPIINANPDYHTFIFSNENLIHRLADFTHNLDNLRDHFEFHVLLVVRDPIEQLGSVYQQLVKRHGYTKGYEDFLCEHGYRCNATNKAAAAVEALENNDIDYSLFNYSILKSSVIEALVRAIGIRDGVIDCSLTAPVNRSMSAAELQLLLFVNAMYGGTVGRQLADSLVNELPNVSAISLAMRQDSWQEVVRTNQASVDIINGRLPSDSHLSFNTKPGFNGDFHCNLSGDQLQLGRQILGSAIQNDILTSAHPKAVTTTHHYAKEWVHQTNRLINLTSRLLQSTHFARKTTSHSNKKRDLN
jgi:hypothetical protein